MPCGFLLVWVERGYAALSTDNGEKTPAIWPVWWSSVFERELEAGQIDPLGFLDARGLTLSAFELKLLRKPLIGDSLAAFEAALADAKGNLGCFGSEGSAGI